MMHFKLLEKHYQAKSKTGRQKEMIKIRAGINEIQTKNLYKESMKQKVGFLKR
jgi:hypothetical protein